VNLGQGYQEGKRAGIYGRDGLSVWVVAGKLTPLRLNLKGIVVVYRAVDQGMILAFLAGVYKAAPMRN